MNIYNCTSEETQSITFVPQLTTKIEMIGTKVTEITTDFALNIQNTTTLQWLDLRNNSLLCIDKTLSNVSHLEHVWLSGNPIHCDCEMTWMIHWINQFMNSEGKHTVVDYLDVKCGNGKFKGLPVYAVTEVLLGCYPNTWSLGQKVGVGMGAATAVLLVLISAFLARKSKEMKFLLFYYLKLDTVPKDEDKDKLENKEYDAFFCYWLVSLIQEPILFFHLTPWTV